MLGEIEGILEPRTLGPSSKGNRSTVNILGEMQYYIVYKRYSEIGSKKLILGVVG